MNEEKRDQFVDTMEQVVKNGDYDRALAMSVECQRIMPWVEKCGPQMVLVQAFCELKLDRDSNET